MPVVGDALRPPAPRSGQGARVRSGRREAGARSAPFSMSTCAAIASAWTPASVRPAACTLASSPVMRWSASSSACCTEGPCSCRCQPMNGPPSYSIVSRQRVTGGSCLRDCEPAQQLVRSHRCTSGALDDPWTNCTLAALNEQRIVQDKSVIPARRESRFFRGLEADPRLRGGDEESTTSAWSSLIRSPFGFEPGAGRGREGADLPFDLGRRLAPVDPRLGLVDLAGIGRAGDRLRLGRRRVVEAIRRASARRDFAISSVTWPAFFPRISSVCRSSIGPVSSPSSICMIVTPLISSPARIARWIGAAPRQRGRSEAWTLMQPSRGASRIGLGRISP